MFKSLEFFVGQTIELEETLAGLIRFGYTKSKHVVVPGDFAQRGGTIDIFPVQYDAPIRLVLDDNKIRCVDTFSLKTGESLWQHTIVIILPFKGIPSPAVFSSSTPLNHFVDIQKGDYVVHNNHGIGRFLGIGPLTGVDQKTQEHLIVEYLGGDKLFVPKTDMHLIQKYVGFTKRPPKLYKLGSKKWRSIRNRIQKRIEQFAGELLHTQALRISLKGYAFAKDTPWQKEFEELFPFKETPDQLKTTLEVKADMESAVPMDRLLCGDVGYGKTEVAMRAAFKAVMDSKQVAILVPTTILAEQHYYNFKKRLKEFPVKVAMLSRFRSRAEQNIIIKELARGKIDIVIGTHRLLSRDISFKELGLLIIDEEQRFGVKAKERLKNLRLLVDVLTLTATPIPRTLYMALAGARDMSVIATPPQNRMAVETHIIEFDQKVIQEAIDYELKRKGQVFFLHNRVEDIDKITLLIKKLAKSAKIAVAHGQMPARLLEEIMLKFFDAQIDILVCTTIIESGIDVPNVNTLLVNAAHRLGLADLHQLRGRVGRFNQKAYAYFIVPPQEALSLPARSRILALEKHHELGAGFQIAFEDLQIRGAGNLLGHQQHGYVTTIGFDLYCRLLKESIGHIRKKSQSPKNSNDQYTMTKQYPINNSTTEAFGIVILVLFVICTLCIGISGGKFL